MTVAGPARELYDDLTSAAAWVDWKFFFTGDNNSRMGPDFGLYMYCKINM